MSEKNPPEFYIKLRSDIVLKNIFRTYVLFTDDCELIFTPTRLIVKSISPDRASFLYTITMKDDCLEFNTHESHSVEIKLDMFNKILNRMNSQDTLTIQFHSEDQILVILSYYKKERKFYLPLTETEHILEADKVSYGKINACTQQGIQFFLSFEDFTTIMKDAIVISNNVDVFFEKSQIRYWNEDEKGHNYQFRLDEFIEHEELDDSFIAGYNVQKLLNYCKNPINTHVNCNLGIPGPAKLSHDDSKQSNL